MKIIKRTVSVILALLMMFSCCTAAAAADDAYDHLPQVYVTGFASANIYFKDDPEKKPLFYPIDTDRILGNIENIDDYIVKSVKNGNPDLLYTCLYSFLWDSFGMLAMNPDGMTNQNENVTVEETVLCYEGDGKYTFYYDSRLSPVDITHQLQDYIELVKEDSGSDKIELVGSSYGASVVIAYLSEYEDEIDSIDSVVLCVPSVLGISFFGELLSGQFEIDPYALKDFVSDSLGMENIGIILGLMNKAGVLDVIIDAMVEPLLREAVYDAVLDIGRDLIATIPAIWTTIPDEYFIPALKTMYGEDYADADHKYAPIIEKMTYYHENIKLKAEEILLEAEKNNEGMEIAIISKYGRPAIPLSKNGNLLDDGLATVEVSSFGATCARYGETFPQDYTQQLYEGYDFISPNGCIDASTCLMPFTTWFIKGLGHSQKNEDYWKFVDMVAYNDLDVFSDSQWPQFIEVSSENPERLVPTAYSEPEKQTTVFQDILTLIKNLLLIPIELIRKLVEA